MTRPGRVAAQLAEDLVVFGIAYELRVPGELHHEASLRLDPTLVVIHQAHELAASADRHRRPRQLEAIADEIVETRRARATIFFVVTFALGIVLAFQLSEPVMLGSTPIGITMMTMVAVLSLMSANRTPVTHPLRQVALFVLVLTLSYGFAWNCVLGRSQAAVLIAYPAAMCWIEVVLALRVRQRERSTA